MIKCLKLKTHQTPPTSAPYVSTGAGRRPNSVWCKKFQEGDEADGSTAYDEDAAGSGRPVDVKDNLVVMNKESNPSRRIDSLRLYTYTPAIAG